MSILYQITAPVYLNLKKQMMSLFLLQNKNALSVALSVNKTQFIMPGTGLFPVLKHNPSRTNCIAAVCSCKKHGSQVSSF